MQQQQADYGFTITKENGRSMFSYSQEKYKTTQLLPIIVTVVIPAFLLTFAFNVRSFGGNFIIWLLLCIGFFMIVKYFMNMGRKARSFIIDDQVFEVDGQRYLRNDINAVYIQEGQGASLPDAKPDYGSVNAMHATTQIVGGIGDRLKKNMSRINCNIVFRYGNRNVTLAKGITRDTAELIVEKISKM